MKSNETLQKDVQDDIKWEPLMNAAEIGVTVKDGIVTLSGTVNSYLKKIEAENAAKNVSGVLGVVENIIVEFSKPINKTDNEIAAEVTYALQCNSDISSENLQIHVENGWVVLTGQQHWDFQKQIARNTVNNLQCTKGVINNISIFLNKHQIVELDDITRALQRNWSIEDKKISVAVVGNTVTLSGIVNSLYQKDTAERITWNAPGVWTVNNELFIEIN